LQLHRIRQQELGSGVEEGLGFSLLFFIPSGTRDPYRIHSVASLHTALRVFLM
jgi:hypothetical protein